MRQYELDVDKKLVYKDARTYTLHDYYDIVEDKREYIRNIVSELRARGFNGYTIYDGIRVHVGIDYETIQTLSK